MESKHKELLIRNRVELVENLNVSDGLFTQLIARKIFNQRMVRTIQHNRSPDQQAEELLNLLPTRGPKAFDAFCDSLKEDLQEHVVDLYLTPKEEEKSETETTNSCSSRLFNGEPSHAETTSFMRIHSHVTVPSTTTSLSYENANLAISGANYTSAVQPRPHSSPPRLINPPDNHHQFFVQYSSNSRDPNQNFSKEELKGEARYKFQHYISDPYYNGLNNDKPRDISHESFQKINSLPHHWDSSPRKFAGNTHILIRNDSVDAMTKNGKEYPDNMEQSAKRPRLAEDEIITIPVFEDPKPKRTPPIVLVSTQSKEIIDPELETGKRLMVPGGEHDDPSLDLTDGPVMVRVESSTRQFYIEHYKKSYSMIRIPRGKALIVNVNEVEGKPPRRGTNIDRDNLYHLFSQLHFDVTIYNDSDGLTAKEIAIKLQEFSELPDHQNADACVVCILSHGEEGYIFGTDGRKIFLDSIMSLFDNSHCKNLRGKPKIFIIQACRGGALDSGVMYGDEHDGAPCKPYQLPTMSDMLICFPTQTGYYAWRNRERGSWYIEALVQVFMKFARTEDVCTMLNRVNSVVSRKISRCPQIEMDQMSQMSEYKSTLRMPHFFFFPGIGSG
ncbi:caspase 2 [Mytilus galloprovincialis]|uniref:Caspase 2 n=1 Tax=Mytilus galloprovincialis TaxID=29158 RepID=A0A8B6DAG8_MYTGA|nr:caspase 2 [Mytilus galloprovincialis]